jgi:heparan-alpha-glucosaminide N-acetyltransferase
LNANPVVLQERLVSMDAFRGMIRLLMVSVGFGIAETDGKILSDWWWKAGRISMIHVRWAVCSLIDLVQPSFMLMVTLSLPWSIANRRANGNLSNNL